MNQQAAKYLLQHGVFKVVDGVPDWMLPLDKLQGFLDLLGPNDIAPGYDRLQRLYQAQAEAVRTLQTQINNYPFTKPSPDGADLSRAHEDE